MVFPTFPTSKRDISVEYVRGRNQQQLYPLYCSLLPYLPISYSAKEMNTLLPWSHTMFPQYMMKSGPNAMNMPMNIKWDKWWQRRRRTAQRIRDSNVEVRRRELRCFSNDHRKLSNLRTFHTGMVPTNKPEMPSPVLLLEITSGSVTFMNLGIITERPRDIYYLMDPS